MFPSGTPLWNCACVFNFRIGGVGLALAKILPDLYPLSSYKNLKLYELIVRLYKVDLFYALPIFFFFVPYDFVLAFLYMLFILNMIFLVCAFFHFAHQSLSFVSVKIHLKINFL